MLADQRVTIRLVRSPLLYGRNTIVSISVSPEPLEPLQKHMM